MSGESQKKELQEENKGGATLKPWENIDIDIRLPLARGVDPGLLLGDIHRRIAGAEVCDTGGV